MAARNVTFESILSGIAARIGLDPTQPLPTSTATALTDYINTRVRFAWESYKWPDMSAIERRQFRETYNASKNYAAGAEVFYLGKYYRRLSAGSGIAPTVASAWTPSAALPDFVRNIDYDQSFTATSDTTPATPIGEVLYVYAADPRVSRYAERVNFWLTNQGAIIGGTQFSNTMPNEVFVEFTTRPATYTTSSGSASVPRCISEYVKFAAAGDALREDGQFDKAAFFDALAIDALQKEVDLIEIKQGQPRLMGSRRDPFPTNPMQKASVSPTGLQVSRSAGPNVNI